jgi:hypothetical protein
MQQSRQIPRGCCPSAYAMAGDRGRDSPLGVKVDEAASVLQTFVVQPRYEFAEASCHVSFACPEQEEGRGRDFTHLQTAVTRRSG